MKRIRFIFVVILAIAFVGAAEELRVQQDQPAEPKSGNASTEKATTDRRYSGMYTFLKEGEFVQVTVEDEGHVTGFISRFGNGESDKGAFLNQFFKNGKLEGNNLNFTTEIVHGVSYDFKGMVERGEGKNPGDEAYYVLRGILTENASDANKKVTSHTRDVLFKLFPQEATPSAVMRK